MAYPKATAKRRLELHAIKKLLAKKRQGASVDASRLNQRFKPPPHCY